MEINSKLGIAIDVCDNGRYGKVKFIFPYPFTTENINAYIDNFDFDNKSLLTVGSSGDQVFNAILNGCKDITLYDICPFAREYFYLKKAAILSMNRNEFFDFFCYRNYPKLFVKNRKAFIESSFFRLLEYLEVDNPEVCYFWLELLKRYKGRNIRKNLFSTDEYEKHMLTKMNRYLESDEDYYRLRSIVEDADVKFVYDNLFSIGNEHKYDNIFLSNVAAYYKLADFKDMFDIMDNVLADDGKMLVAYLYDTDVNYEYTRGEDEIYNLPLVYEMFPKDLKLSTFVGNNGLRLRDGKMRDSVLTYKKVKKI